MPKQKIFSQEIKKIIQEFKKELKESEENNRRRLRENDQLLLAYLNDEGQDRRYSKSNERRWL